MVIIQFYYLDIQCSLYYSFIYFHVYYQMKDEKYNRELISEVIIARTYFVVTQNLCCISAHTPLCPQNHRRRHECAALTTAKTRSHCCAEVSTLQRSAITTTIDRNNDRSSRPQKQLPSTALYIFLDPVTYHFVQQ